MTEIAIYDQPVFRACLWSKKAEIETQFRSGVM